MKFSTFTATTVAALAITSSALAADLPSRRAVVVPPPPPIFTWTGPYIGVNAGATFSNNNSATSVGFPIALTNIGAAAGGAPIQNAIDASLTGITGASSQTAAIFGAQAGYNYQFASAFLVGIEADIQGVAGSRKTSVFGNFAPIVSAPGFGVSNATAVQRRVDYLGTVRARLGYTVTPTLLLYATGGLAYGGVRSSTLSSPFIAPPQAVANTLPISGTRGGYATTRVGYTIGGGIEWMYFPNWSLKAEYLYYNLGTANYNAGASTFSQPGGLGLISLDGVRTRLKYDGHIARVGINYHFWTPAAPVVARY